MRPKTYKGLAACAVLAAILWAALARNYYIEAPPSLGQVLWNENEAFLIIGTSDVGWVYTRIGLLRNAVMKRARHPADLATGLIIIHYDQNGVHDNEVPGATYGRFAIVDDALYGPDGKWNGHTFEPVTDAERGRVSAAGPISLDNAGGGWQEQQSLLSAGTTTLVPMLVQGQQLQLRIEAPSAVRRIVTLERGDDTVATLSIDGAMHRVSAGEYRKRFHPSG